MNLGVLIRKYRKEQKLTLKEVAEKAGVSEGFLSQVENDVNSPSIDTLMKICDALGVNAGDLLNQIKNQDRLITIRKSEWDDFEIPRSGFATRRFFPPENRVVIDSAILVIKPGGSIPVRKDIKNAQEILSVLKGSIELVHAENRFILTEGDAVHFWSDSANQQITNVEKDISVALWVGTV
jgi:transcriptional regulator with XRE-family HTH domain